MKSLETPAIITSLSSKSDGSLGLRVATPELSAEEKVAFMSLQNMNVKMTIEPTDEKFTDKIKVEKGLDGKSPSQRLYNVLYVYYKQVKSIDEFDVFYKRHMESLIDTYKSRLIDK